MDPEFHLLIKFSHLEDKPLKLQSVVVVVRLQWMDCRGMQRVGAEQICIRGLRWR